MIDEKNKNEELKENEKDINDTVLQLKKPVLIDGEERTEIPYDFDNLTGRDVDQVFKSLTKRGYVLTGPYEVDPVVGAAMFAQAAGLDYTDLERFSAKDYAKAGTLGRNFFIIDLNGNQTENI